MANGDLADMPGNGVMGSQELAGNADFCLLVDCGDIW